jgi:hypothetical protein
MDTVDQLAVRRNHSDPGGVLTPGPATPQGHIVIGCSLPAVMKFPSIGKADGFPRNVTDMEQPIQRSAPLLTGAGAEF